MTNEMLNIKAPNMFYLNEQGSSTEISKIRISSDSEKLMASVREIENSTRPWLGSGISYNTQNFLPKDVEFGKRIENRLYNINKTTLSESLFDATGNVKILFSQVSMHFDNELREKLFRQIDLIHDVDDWEDGENPIKVESFRTFLRWFYNFKPSKLPNFGLSSRGNFIASWMGKNSQESLVLEFMQKDRIKWFKTKYFDGEVDHSIGSTRLSRISEELDTHDTKYWFTKDI